MGDKMKSPTVRFFPLSIIAAALYGAFGPALAQDADEIARLTKPSSSVEVGIGYVSDDNQRFGQYTGLNEDGAYGLIGLDVNRRDDATGTWLRLTGRNVGLDSRELRFENERQGNWGYFIDFSQTPRFDPFTVTTRLTGIGTTTQTLLGSATAQQYHLKTERDKITVGFDKMLAKGLGLEVRFSNEEKEGDRLWGQGTFGPNGWVFLTDPIDQTTQQLEAKVNYTTERFQLSGGYYGTMFENKNNLLSVPGSPIFPEMALPPDNESHQVFLAGGYNFSKATRGNFKVAFGRITQNELFPTTPIVGAPASLNGQIDTTLIQGGLTTRVSPAFSMRADLRYENRDDKTPIFRYFPTQDTAGSTNNGRNEARDIETTSAKLDAYYRLPMDLRLSGGVEFVEKKRNAIPVRSVSFREKTDETSIRAEVRRSISETLTGAVSAVHSRRRGSDWLINLNNGGTATTGDLNAPLHLADRDRNTLGLALNWMPTEPLALGFRADISNDDYSGRNLVPFDLGPREGKGQFLSADASYMFTDEVQGTAWVSHGVNSFENALCRDDTPNTCTATDPRPVWAAEQTNTATSFGLGVRAKLTSRIDMTADASYSNVKDEIDLTSISPTTSSAITLLPDINTKVTTVKLSAKYALQRNASVRLTYIHDQYKTDDWTWAFWNYTPLTDGGTTVLQNPKQKVDFVGVSYIYRF